MPSGCAARRGSSPVSRSTGAAWSASSTGTCKIEQFQIGEAAAKEISAGLRLQRAARAAGRHRRRGRRGRRARSAIPVAMKIVSPDIIHKSDIGGVKLNLVSPTAVRDAFDLMMLRIRQRVPEARIEGVYVEKMCETRPRSHPRHDARSAVRPHADVRPGRHLRRSHEGRDLPHRADHGGRSHADAGEHAVVRPAEGRARPGQRGPRGHRHRPAAHQPAGHRFPADRGNGHQPVHRRARSAPNPWPPMPASRLATEEEQT